MEITKLDLGSGWFPVWRSRFPAEMRQITTGMDEFFKGVGELPPERVGEFPREFPESHAISQPESCPQSSNCNCTSFVLSFSYIMLIVVFWLFLVHAHTLLLKEAFVYFYERLSWFLVVSALFIFLEGRET